MDEIYFVPDKIEFEPGIPFDVEVWLATPGIVAIDGVDVDIPLPEGVEKVNVVLTNLLGLNFLAPVDKILFLHTTNPPNKFSGTGKLATLTLKATVDTIMKFNFTVGATNDTNMAVGGVDILTDVNELIIKKGDPMAIDSVLLADLQTVANTHKDKLSKMTVTVTPITADETVEIFPS